MLETRLSIVGWVLFQDSNSADDLEDTKSTSAKNLTPLQKPNICSHKLDVQETDCCFAQFYRNEQLFLWMLFFEWMDSFLSIYGMW